MKLNTREIRIFEFAKINLRKMSKFSGKTIEKHKIRIVKISDHGRFAKLNPYEI